MKKIKNIFNEKIVLIFLITLIGTMANAQTFVDITSSAGINLPAGLGDVVVWMDYNNDDYPDFFCSSDSQTSFYKNNGDGTFMDITQQTNLGNTSPFTLSVGDYNNDGYADLLITSMNIGDPVKVFRNNQSNGFEVVYSTVFHGIRAIWMDFNNDGLLDIFCNTGSNAYMLKNKGDDTFEDISEGMGFNPYSGETASAADVNNDGFLDIYCTNSSTSKTNRLYLNEAGSAFFDVTFSSGTSDFRSGVAQSWGDFNSDGHMDLYIGNISSNRNILFENNGNVHFTDQTLVAGVSDDGDARTNAWIDFNNDGLLDLFTTNHVNPNKLYHNNGDGTFTDIAQNAGISSPQDGFSVSWADYDKDGDVDVLISGHSYSTKLLRNDGGNSMNYLNVRLVGEYDNKSGIGSRVTIYCNGQAQVREVNGGRGSVSQDDLSLHFGVGNCEIVDSLIINWPSGMLQKQYNVSVNQFITIIQDGNVPPTLFHLITPLPDSIYSGTEVLFSWSMAFDPDSSGQVNYYININGLQNDTTLGPFLDTTQMVIMSNWMNDDSVFWSVIANDGSSIRRSWEEWPIFYSGTIGIEYLGKSPENDFLILSYQHLLSTEEIKLDIEVFDYAEINAILISIEGMMVNEFNTKRLFNGIHSLHFPVRNLQSGIYILLLKTKNTRKALKLHILNQ